MITKRIEQEERYLNFNANMYGIYLEVGSRGAYGDEYENMFIEELEELEELKKEIDKAINNHLKNK